MNARPGYPRLAGSPLLRARFAAGAILVGDRCDGLRLADQATGDTPRVAPLGPTTLRACDGAIMELGAAFTEALLTASAFGGTSCGTAIDDGRRWLASVLAGSEPALAFGVDGTLAGFAGCNRFTATVAENAPISVIGPRRDATRLRRACGRDGAERRALSRARDGRGSPASRASTSSFTPRAAWSPSAWREDRDRAAAGSAAPVEP